MYRAFCHLADGVRVLTRTLQRLRARVTAASGPVRDRTRSVARRVFELAQRSRTATGRSQPTVRARSQARMTQLYRELMHITRAVVRDADAVGAAVDRRPQALTGMREHLRTTVGLVQRVLAQTRARVLKGDTHYPGKVLSLFEPHTEAIRKGKAAKPTEFGKVVKIQEVEAQFITDLRGLRDARAGWHAVGALAGPPHPALRPRAPTGRRRCRLRLAEQRARGDRPRRPLRRSAARPSTSSTAMVSARAPVAHRLRGPDQRAQAPSWTRPLSLSWTRRHGALGRARGHCEQLVGLGTSEPMRTELRGRSAPSDGSRQTEGIGSFGHSPLRYHARVRRHFCTGK